MSTRVCPWWLGWLLASPVRKLFQDPARILAPHVREGMTVLEPGPGMGFFTLELARRVGPAGRVFAVDLQPRMLAGLRRRADRAGLGARVVTRVAARDSLGVEDLRGAVSFVLAFALVHELPDAARFFAEIRAALAPSGKVLVAEPAGHVKRADFEATLAAAERAGFRREPGPPIARSLTAVLAAA
ncbi:class I SAM-dependent methyltransferase [Anaeromyxobacter oryzae]|uniref:Type 11 methyltransferase n=1 Tax=Anaeromyxobacter oryzae TaxID=2918170 RepID=A0ABM7X1H0_9BACT|nr:methyltransferase domain-containing protein [Anaeromyxobacter oryzae]BDG05638.1 type 11 methyltransferase [Anaeromyxobacter oryzae]